MLPNGEVMTNEEDEYEGMPSLVEKDDEKEIKKQPSHGLVGLVA